MRVSYQWRKTCPSDTFGLKFEETWRKTAAAALILLRGRFVRDEVRGIYENPRDIAVSKAHPRQIESITLDRRDAL